VTIGRRSGLPTGRPANVCGVSVRVTDRGETAATSALTDAQGRVRVRGGQQCWRHGEKVWELRDGEDVTDRVVDRW